MKKIKVRELYEMFQRDNRLKQLAPSSIKDYDYFLQGFFAWLPTKVKYGYQLNSTLYNDYKLSVIERIPNKVSQNTYLRAVKRFINFGAEIEACPVFKMKLIKVGRIVKPTFTDDDIRKIIYTKDCSKQNCIALLILATGIRSATIRALCVDDIDFPDKLLILRHTKNGNQNILPLPDPVLIKLSRYIRINNKEGKDLLFCTEAGKPYNASALNHYMGDYFRRIGLSKVGIHIMRHTFGRIVASEGCPSITLSHYLTHSSIQQSEEYVNLYGQELRNACEQYNPVLVMSAKGIEKTSRD